MSEQSLADRVHQAIQRPGTLQLGAVPVLYPILETLGLRETVDTGEH